MEEEKQNIIEYEKSGIQGMASKEISRSIC